ncbi:MAG TPA: hypothetical protein VKH19_01925 [Gemmatimonadaceae bacterium]|nr:hypothetical protein [Gemmatimonadaceae bacterium]
MRMRAWAVGVFLGCAACNWLSLAKNALSYEMTARGEAANVVSRDSVAFVALGADGVGVVDGRTGARLSVLPPPAGSESVDDVAVADSVLFVLDARPPGHLSAYALRGDSLRLATAPRGVAVGPFSGVSAANGVVVVSGGTARMTAWRYDASGVQPDTVPFATTDLGRGQPDVLVTAGFAFVSTHFWGPYFGLDIIRVGGDSLPLVATLELPGAGFTAGGAKPANFPIEMAQLNDTTLLIAFERGVAVVDVAHPATPRVLRVIDVGGPGVNVDAAHGVAAVVVAGRSPAVAIVDGARVVRRIPLPPGTKPLGVALSGARAERVIVAARDRGVMIVSR